MPRSSPLTLSERSVLGMFYIQRYRFLTISQFAREMRCEPEFLQGMRKRKGTSEFACYIRNFAPSPVRLIVPLGEMERRPKLIGSEYEALLEANRGRYGAGRSKVGVRWQG